EAAMAELELDGEEQDDGSGAEQRLTQQVRPTRKAGKKALDEMHRETQRLARNMQLAHEARTKKKVTRESLFMRFNYHPKGFEPVEEKEQSGEQAKSYGSELQQSDVE